MSIPDFTVNKGPVPKAKRQLKAAASFNTSGDGPLIQNSDAGSSSAPKRNGTPQTRSPAGNVNPKQFTNSPYVGKRRASQGRHASAGSDTGYRGSHARGAHGKEYNLDSDLEKSRSTDQHVGAHSERSPKPEGKHGKPYNPARDIRSSKKESTGRHSTTAFRPEGKHGKAYSMSNDLKKNAKDRQLGSVYAPKHTAQGQSIRKQEFKKQARQHATAEYDRNVRHIMHAVHRVDRVLGHGEHYSNYLTKLERKI